VKLGKLGYKDFVGEVFCNWLWSRWSEIRIFWIADFDFLPFLLLSQRMRIVTWGQDSPFPCPVAENSTASSVLFQKPGYSFGWKTDYIFSRSLVFLNFAWTGGAEVVVLFCVKNFWKNGTKTNWLHLGASGIPLGHQSISVCFLSRLKWACAGGGPVMAKLLLFSPAYVDKGTGSLDIEEFSPGHLLWALQCTGIQWCQRILRICKDLYFFYLA